MDWRRFLYLPRPLPAPVADSFVESAFYGGYDIAETEPVAHKGAGFLPDLRRPEAIERLRKLEGQKADFQMAEMRGLLLLILEMLQV